MKTPARIIVLALMVAAACSGRTLCAQTPGGQASPLDGLIWMNGEWVARLGETQIRTTCDWNQSRRFLIRHIYVVRGGQTLHSIGQRIGYDAAAKTIKIWSFDVDGSHAEGTATQEGDNWVFTTSGIARDGHQVQSTNTYSAIGPEGFTVTSVSTPEGGAEKKSETKFTPDKGIAAAVTDQEAEAEVTADPAKRAIFASKEWREVRNALRQWLSVQDIYSPAEVAAMKAQIESKITAMSADELQQFMDDVRDRLKVLLSPEGEEARSWLAQYTAVRTLSKEQWEKTRPDVVHMTAQQLKEKLLQINQQRAAVAQQNQQAAKARDIQAQAVRQEVQYQRQSAERALDRAYYDDYGSFRW